MHLPNTYLILLHKTDKFVQNPFATDNVYVQRTGEIVGKIVKMAASMTNFSPDRGKSRNL